MFEEPLLSQMIIEYRALWPLVAVKAPLLPSHNALFYNEL